MQCTNVHDLIDVPMRYRGRRHRGTRNSILEYVMSAAWAVVARPTSPCSLSPWPWKAVKLLSASKTVIKHGTAGGNTTVFEGVQIIHMVVIWE